MPYRIGFKQPHERHRTFFKEWRLYRELSMERLAEKLETSVASISRIESGEQPYTQDFLEALADVLKTDPASLLTRNPESPDAMWAIWDQAKAADRTMIEEVARTIVKTGTRK